ncbi:hypothetical protein C3486_00290 [Streptomyces sp. Ru73]|uniref:hypothetical protein n=1 Tax=Streptomyces sp. Ru73 TaxID=2080748 RepID=UPI000CDDD639|nr:hypothetical protein [Streptomyces sp. Ru73]POX43406.1 hypothetical protein C3486_00290 [Streptomyces sp. Ru73]
MTSGQAGEAGDQSAKDFHFPALVNGLDFLVSAVDSLAIRSGPERRELKYAVLHLRAAAETLLKARLEMHDPALVWVKPGIFNDAQHKAGDFKSCGIETAIKRLNSLSDDEGCDVALETLLDPDDDNLTQLGALRNRIMHFGWSDSAVAVQARTVPVLALLVEFVSADVLPYVESPADSWAAEQQMERVREQLRHLEDFVAHQVESLRGLLDGYEASTVACRSCGQFVVVLDGGAIDLSCLFCKKSYGTGEEAAWEFVGMSRHLTIKEGGGDFAPCTSCGASAVVDVHTASSPDAISWICFACGTEFEGICAFCGLGTYLAMEDMCNDCYEIRLENF